MQTPRRINDQDVDAARPCRLDRIEGDGCRIGTFLVANDRNPRAIAPNLQLIDGGSAEGVGGSEHDGLALLLVVGGKLADRRRLANAVDADDEKHRRPCGSDPRFVRTC